MDHEEYHYYARIDGNLIVLKWRMCYSPTWWQDQDYHKCIWIELEEAPDQLYVFQCQERTAEDLNPYGKLSIE